MGRILEDRGSTLAAIEVYTMLVKANPMYIECYVRLGVIQKELGQVEVALHWVKKALDCVEKQLEAQSQSQSQSSGDPNSNSNAAVLNMGIHKNNCHMLMGYLYAINGNMERGQKEYDQICRKVHYSTVCMECV